MEYTTLKDCTQNVNLFKNVMADLEENFPDYQSVTESKQLFDRQITRLDQMATNLVSEFAWLEDRLAKKSKSDDYELRTLHELRTEFEKAQNHLAFYYLSSLF
ncbi:hypothetical protein IJ095_03035 [Candidatus Saccharibacteria bacterium]|nr:hypothetical protein [Candidatus Saccharibacteria bacterium]